jgi:hypothetical protein
MAGRRLNRRRPACQRTCGGGPDDGGADACRTDQPAAGETRALLIGRRLWVTWGLTWER